MNTQVIISTVSQSNQVAVPSIIRKKLGIESGGKMRWLYTKDKKVLVEKIPDDWGVYMSGLGKEIWAKIEVEKYLKDLRKDREVFSTKK